MATSRWEPLVVGRPVNPNTPMASEHIRTDGRKTYYKYREQRRTIECTAFGNRLYDGVALTFEDGSMHLSFKRRDRAAVRDWRHFQAIKNEVAGTDREAVELFPAEYNLTDAANEYHLWVLAPGHRMPLGLDGYAVAENEDTLDWASYRQSGGSVGVGGRQRPWEDGIPTGLPFQEQVFTAARALLESGWRPEEDAA